MEIALLQKIEEGHRNVTALLVKALGDKVADDNKIYAVVVDDKIVAIRADTMLTKTFGWRGPTHISLPDVSETHLVSKEKIGLRGYIEKNDYFAYKQNGVVPQIHGLVFGHLTKIIDEDKLKELSSRQITDSNFYVRIDWPAQTYARLSQPVSNIILPSIEKLVKKSGEPRENFSLAFII